MEVASLNRCGVARGTSTARLRRSAQCDTLVLRGVLPDAEQNLDVVGSHRAWIPRRGEGDLDVGVFDALERSHFVYDRLLEHRPNGTHRRRERHHHVHVLAVVTLDGDIVNQPKFEDAKVQLGVLDVDERFAHLLNGRHEVGIPRLPGKTPGTPGGRTWLARRTT